jgi:5-hydroxyisourate hydrolase
MSTVSTHVLDTARGAPAVGIAVALERVAVEVEPIASGVTDSDGRVANLGPEGLDGGTYRLRFDTRAYYAESNTGAFFPEVVVVFDVGDQEHYHVPLLLSPFAYSTYRGS